MKKCIVRAANVLLLLHACSSLLIHLLTTAAAFLHLMLAGLILLCHPCPQHTSGGLRMKRAS